MAGCEYVCFGRWKQQGGVDEGVYQQSTLVSEDPKPSRTPLTAPNFRHGSTIVIEDPFLHTPQIDDGTRLRSHRRKSPRSPHGNKLSFPQASPTRAPKSEYSIVFAGCFPAAQSLSADRQTLLLLLWKNTRKGREEKKDRQVRLPTSHPLGCFPLSDLRARPFFSYSKSLAAFQASRSPPQIPGGPRGLEARIGSLSKWALVLSRGRGAVRELCLVTRLFRQGLY